MPLGFFEFQINNIKIHRTVPKHESLECCNMLRMHRTFVLFLIPSAFTNQLKTNCVCFPLCFSSIFANKQPNVDDFEKYAETLNCHVIVKITHSMVMQREKRRCYFLLVQFSELNMNRVTANKRKSVYIYRNLLT